MLKIFLFLCIGPILFRRSFCHILAIQKSMKKRILKNLSFTYFAWFLFKNIVHLTKCTALEKRLFRCHKGH